MEPATVLAPSCPASSGAFVTYLSDIARMTGSTDAALLLSYLWGWQRGATAQERGGWLWATQAQIETDTGLTRYQQESARARLRACGLLEEERRGLPRRLWYHIVAERLEAILTAFEARRNPAPPASTPTVKPPRQPRLPLAAPPSSAGKSRIPVCGKSADKSGAEQHAIASSSSSPFSTTSSYAPLDTAQTPTTCDDAFTPDGKIPDETPDTLRRMIEAGVTESRARRLYELRGEEVCRLQLEYLPHRPIRTTAGAVLAEAIQAKWDAPRAYRDAQKAAQDARQREERARTAKVSAEPQETAQKAEEAQIQAFLDALEAGRRAALERQALENVRARYKHTRARLDAGEIGAATAALIRTALRELVLPLCASPPPLAT